MPGSPPNLDDSKVTVFCACSVYSSGLFGFFLSSIIFLFLSPALWEMAQYS